MSAEVTVYSTEKAGTKTAHFVKMCSEPVRESVMRMLTPPVLTVVWSKSQKVEAAKTSNRQVSKV